MKNKTLNIIGICGTGLGIVIAWCVRYAMYFFHDHRPLNFLPVLLIQAAALALFLVMWRVKLPAWVSVVSLAAGGLGLVLSLVVAIVNLPNLPISATTCWRCCLFWFSVRRRPHSICYTTG